MVIAVSAGLNMITSSPGAVTIAPPVQSEAETSVDGADPVDGQSDETHAAATSAGRRANFSRERKCRLPGRGRHPFRAIGDRQPVIKMNLGTTVLGLFGTRDGPARSLPLRTRREVVESPPRG